MTVHLLLTDDQQIHGAYTAIYQSSCPILVHYLLPLLSSHYINKNNHVLTFILVLLEISRDVVANGGVRNTCSVERSLPTYY